MLRFVDHISGGKIPAIDEGGLYEDEVFKDTREAPKADDFYTLQAGLVWNKATGRYEVPGATSYPELTSPNGRHFSTSGTGLIPEKVDSLEDLENYGSKTQQSPTDLYYEYDENGRIIY